MSIALRSQPSIILNLLNAAKCWTINTTQALQLKTHARNRPPPRHNMKRVWEPAVGATKSPSPDHQYVLMSYNILAQDLLHAHLYLYMDTDPALLRWDHRLHRLRDEILDVLPDILCLQEMQVNHLKQLVNLIRGGRQLEYLYKKKTGVSTDGCAIIYDRSKFRLIDQCAVEYHKAGSTLLNRQNVALMAKFTARENNEHTFVVATTHLLYNPRRQDVRMAQVEVLLAALRKFSRDQSKNNTLLPVLLTGDFNFEPNTPPYTLLSSANSTPPEKIQQDNATQDTSPNEALRESFFKFTAQRRRADDDCLEMCPLNFGLKTASTFQDGWITVDYILHSIGKNRKKIRIWSIYKLPAIKDCNSFGKIPNKFLGSDHYSLAITFSVP